MNLRIFVLINVLIVFFFNVNAQSDIERLTFDLSGQWEFLLDSNDVGISEKYYTKKLNDVVQLPGTTDTNHKGIANRNKEETTNLSRLYKYEGAAWYSKEVEISNQWMTKEINLFLERTRPTMVWVDGNYIGKSINLSTPHRYNLTTSLTSGKHRITIRVDNGKSIPQNIRSSSHSCTEATQTNWNGIIGRIELQAVNQLHIASMRVFPIVSQRSVKIKLSLSKSIGLNGKEIKIYASTINGAKQQNTKPALFTLNEGQDNYEFIYPLGKDAHLWSEHNPILYKLSAEISGADKFSVNIGLREFKASGNHFAINGKQTFLRGKHDACVFPLTGYTAMDLEQWRRYFRICKDYGLNHCRFHSWCPPSACFEAADLEGIYLQPELPIWGSFKKDSNELLPFLMNDGENIQHEYSNHASFVLFALGNELGGDIDVMQEFVTRFRAIESGHLYAFGSNNFLGSKGYIPGEDFLVTCRVGNGEGYSTHTRATFSFADAEEGGYLNNTYPNSVMNFDAALIRSKVPVIGHETGQFQTYPNFGEMKKYTGVLAPWNFEVFRSRLEKVGMLNQAEDFFKASGAWSVELYRADIEMNLRSKHISGFQLLDLQDYPGQGSSYVGILDAFLDSKGLIMPEKWREFCNDVVPLLILPKFCWNAQDVLAGEVKISNYGIGSLKGKDMNWELTVGENTLQKGEFIVPDGTGLLNVGQLLIQLPDIKKAVKANLELHIKGTQYRNNYPLWIYPNSKVIIPKGILVTRELTKEVLDTLQNGGKVLFIPKKDSCRAVTVDGLFQTDYWNYRMFKSICDRIKKPASPGTLGILTNPEHKLFNNFPTEFHTNWQWYPIIKNSYPLILDKLPHSYLPIVQVIDNVERNYKLGLAFEFIVEKGKLFVCMSDLETIQDIPEGRQFFTSIIEYLNSSDFSPKYQVTVDELENLFSTEIRSENIKQLHNISY